MSEERACPWSGEHHTADLRQRLDEAEARIAELEASLEWRPIESAPKDGRVILGHADKCIFAMTFHPSWWFRGKAYSHASDNGGWVAQGYGCACHWGVSREGENSIFALSPNVVRPTHWRPLGPGPEGSE